jgi:hypothetical protein
MAERMATLTAIGRCVEAVLAAGGIVRAVGMGTLQLVSVEMLGGERQTWQGADGAPWVRAEAWVRQQVATR